MDACLEASMNDCLTKPVDNRELLATIYRLTAGISEDTAPESRLPVLVVDDTSINRVVASKQLAKLGIPCQTSADAPGALKLAQRQRYAAILVDIVMPELNGIEFTEQLRQWEEGRGYRTPVIAVTGRTDPDDRARYLAAGIDDVLANPPPPSTWKPHWRSGAPHRWSPPLIACCRGRPSPELVINPRQLISRVSQRSSARMTKHHSWRCWRCSVTSSQACFKT